MDDKLVQFIIVVVIALGTAFFNWVKKKGDVLPDDDWGEEPPTAPPRPVQPGRTSEPPRPPRNWEEELRRMLAGEEPQQPAPPRPPPVPAQPNPPPRAGMERPLPPAMPIPLPQPPRIPRPMPVPLPQAPLFPAPSVLPEEETERGLPVKLPSLAESAQAYLRASQLDVKVAEHLREVGQRVRVHGPTAAVRRAPSEIAHARALLRDRQSLRAAIIASVVLGPPKAADF